MRNDPYLKFNFLVEIDDLAVGGFSEMTGLNVEATPIEYREGGDPARMRKLPGLAKFNNITLKRGITTNPVLWEWHKTTLDGATQRHNGAIILLDEARVPALRWEFFEAWVAKYEGPPLNASTNEAAIESIDLAVESVRLAG
ncbi:phage tail protein [Actinoplanes sp. NPDC049596]|uniref:phage tail protein n=1 Tax=unclassified Actinoplanes TaxID=2626549 RepID=UPI00342DD11B